MSTANAPTTSPAPTAPPPTPTTQPQSTTAADGSPTTAPSSAAQGAPAAAAVESAAPPKAPPAEPAKATEATKPAPESETIAALTARLAQLEAQAAQATGQAKRAAKASYLQGAVHPDVIDLAPDVELTSDGNLTTAARTKLDAWRAERPQLFGRPSDAASRTTPTARQTFSANELGVLKANGIDVDARRANTLAALTGGFRGGLA